MNVSPKDVADLVAELAKVPALSKIPDRKLGQLAGMVIQETTDTNKRIEDRLSDAGGIPPDITLILMHYGALLAIVEDLPEGNERRQLVEAGQIVGRLIAKKFGEKIASQLAEKARTH